MPALLLALAALACGSFGPTATLPPAPETATASPSPGPGTPTPRPDTQTQPAATDGSPVTGATSDVTALPPVEGEVFARVAAIAPEVPGTVSALRFTPDGTLWLLTDQAVARLVGDTWEVYLDEYDGAMVGLDALHRVWVAAADGATIEAWDGEAWQAYGAAEGWAPVAPGPAGNMVQPGLTADQAGRVWVATGADVRAFDGEQWQIFDRAAIGMAEAGEATAWFTLAVARRDGWVWVSACDMIASGPSGGGGVRWFDGDAWQGAASPVDAGCGGAIATSAQGTVWVGLDAAVLEYDPETTKWTTHAAPAPPSGERFGYVAGLALDLSERPWPLMAICGGASCDAGHVRYQIAEDGTWRQIGEVADGAQTLFFDTSGDGWLLGEAGALRARGNEVQPAGDMRVLASTQDSVGQIYVAGELAGEVALWLIRPGTG